MSPGFLGSFADLAVLVSLRCLNTGETIPGMRLEERANSRAWVSDSVDEFGKLRVNRALYLGA